MMNYCQWVLEYNAHLESNGYSLLVLKEDVQSTSAFMKQVCDISNARIVRANWINLNVASMDWVTMALYY